MTRKGLTTNQRCYPLLREYGYSYDCVEQFNPATRRRSDFGGFADILAWRPIGSKDLITYPGIAFDSGFNFQGSLAIQTCSTGVVEHIKKLTEGAPRHELARWLDSGNRCEIWGWTRRKPRGTKQVRIVPRFKRIIKINDRFEIYDNSELFVFGYRPPFHKPSDAKETIQCNCP